jgi:hypothetical protein
MFQLKKYLKKTTIVLIEQRRKGVLFKVQFYPNLQKNKNIQQFPKKNYILMSKIQQ